MPTPDPPATGRYHHGDLANALVEASLELATNGGPTAISLRQAARAIGVSAPAAYRHFADLEALIKAVSVRCLNELGHALEVASRQTTDPVERLAAIGRAYVTFGRRNPGKLATAFHNMDVADLTGVASSASELPGLEVDPYRTLADALDALLAAGTISPTRRDGAEIIAWSSVHGVAVLFSPSNLPDQLIEDATEQVVQGVLRSIGAVPAN